MKKTVLIAAICFLSTWTSAVLVDGFDGYSTGQIDGVTGGAWVSTKAAANTAATLPLSTMVIATDPTNAGNQILSARPTGGQCGLYGVLTGSEIVADNTTRTMSLKFRLTTITSDASFGLTTLDTPSEFGNTFNAQCALINGTFRARNGGTTSGSLATIAANTWYYVWVVVNNTANTYDVYLKTTASDATTTDLVADNYAFRTGTPDGDLDRFFVMMQNTNVDILFDDINMSNGENLSLTRPASNPSPAIGATGVLTDAILSWTTGADPANPANPNPNITKHYVSFKKGDPNFASGATLGEVSPASTTSWTPPTTGSNAMDMDGTYYWRIDESVNNSSRTDPNTIMGSVWRYETVKSVPVITQQPVSLRAAEGTSAQLSVVFTSITPAAVTWKKYVDGVNDQTITAGVDTSDVSNVWTSTLTFASLSVTDDGQYYCLIVNDGTGSDSVKSNTVIVITNRLLAQYDFNNSLNPAVGSAADAPTGQGKSIAGLTEPNSLLAANVTLSFETGYDGTVNGAVKLDDPNLYIDFGTGGYPKAGSLIGGIGGGLDACTILCWVKPVQMNHTLDVLSCYNLGNTTGVRCSVETNMDIRINARGEAAEILTAQGKSNRPEYNLFDGWHLIGASWDAQAQLSAVYVDGQWVAADTTMATPTQYAAWQYGVRVGAGFQGSPNRHLLTNFFSGAIDNLRIYNYRVDAAIIANEYYTATGIKPCTNSAFTGSTYNFDNTGASYCIVDIADFVVFASQWLKEGLYP